MRITPQLALLRSWRVPSYWVKTILIHGIVFATTAKRSPDCSNDNQPRLGDHLQADCLDAVPFLYTADSRPVGHDNMHHKTQEMRRHIRIHSRFKNAYYKSQ
jgi:hypothetical protein